MKVYNEGKDVPQLHRGGTTFVIQQAVSIYPASLKLPGRFLQVCKNPN